ncbi:cysteine proteinase 4-like isoform X2 [Rhineura floridana]|uniref:cysteine proteinase 4-like isoform X2 n=1 Tax=Rhineura floridana TaxID=261503 RepID=UPI002AC887D8|nr:cysteine proteinase 4-like isoform X2 [Rhineura floridana]
MEMYSFFVVIFCAGFMPKALGFPLSDVSIDCSSMLPNRGGGPQTSTPPYVISVSFDKYDPGNEIQVVLEGTSPSGFKAFMVQAREINGNVPVGMFRIVDPSTQGFACASVPNSAAIHANTSIKHKITTTWVAPQETKKIRLMATFVQDDDTYWVGVHSKTLSPRHSEIVNTSETYSDSMTTNTSDIVSDFVTSVVSDLIGDYNANSNHEDVDFNTLLAVSEAEYEPETPVDSEENQDPRKNATARSKRKSVVTVNVNCGEAGALQSSSGGCVKAQGSSQSSGSQSKVIVVKQGSSSGSGCVGGAVASVYNKHACRDSVSTDTGKVKVVTYPESNPYPPERGNTYSSKIVNSNYGGIIYSQGSKPQSGSSESVRISIQSGKVVPACDKSKPTYNIQVCNQLGQPSSSQSSSSVNIQGQSSSSQSGSSSGKQQGGSYSSGGSSCGQGITYDSNPCNQGSSSSSSSSSSYSNQGKDTSYNRC